MPDLTPEATARPRKRPALEIKATSQDLQTLAAQLANIFKMKADTDLALYTVEIRGTDADHNTLEAVLTESPRPEASWK